MDYPDEGTIDRYGGAVVELASLESQRAKDLVPLQNDDDDDEASSSSSPLLILNERKHAFSQKQRSQTKLASILSLATICLLAIVTITFHSMRFISPDHNEFTPIRDSSSSSSSSSSTFQRFLDEQQDDNQNYQNGKYYPGRYDDDATDDSSQTDYASYDCEDIFTLTDPNTANRCLYAQTCNHNSGLFCSFIFCNNNTLSAYAWVAVLSPLLAIWLVVLFRMLGSTAEDYFSPSLEMFSMKMGLPPRFAGVTLLALGNGAADVSATISAIVNNPEGGYEMSIGALTGAAMFVGTVVAGIVIVTADGVGCRGALVRDVVVLMFTTVVVFLFFEKGYIGSGAIRTMLILYLTFVLVVLAADVYHRRVVLPRIQARNEREAAAIAAEEEEAAAIAAAAALAEAGSKPDNRPSGDNGESNRGLLGAVPESTSNVESLPDYKVGDVGIQEAPPPAESAAGITRQSTPHPAGLHQATPTVSASGRRLRNQNRKKSTVGFGEKIAVAFSNYEKDEGRMSKVQKYQKGWGSKWNVTTKEMDRPLQVYGADGILRSESEQVEEVENRVDANGEPITAFSILLDNMDHMCGAETNGNYNNLENLRNVTFFEQFRRGWDEFWSNFTDLWKDIFENEENKTVDKFFLVCELPFMVARKLTVPIPCEGYYCRSLVALSLTLIPLWVALYALIQRETNLFYNGEGLPNFAISMVFAVIIGYTFLVFAPKDVNDLSLKVAGPIAFAGFLMAALWIDTIADLLVELLTFLGVICGIPNSIMGLTILAWGNSMGDLSANMTMAKKGLANMAITACFAGPVFNILVGLGGGFYQLNHLTGVDETEVNLSLPNILGFAFIIINCLLVLVYGICINMGKLSKEFGYTALGLYVVYVISCVAVQFLR